ncbi:MAG: RHS repeat-associated core domain-containing protein, partial [Nitrososphaera sp.]|nr:RHS repeat-associated core domain-containing protein [Nitrososphaera sp.]
TGIVRHDYLPFGEEIGAGVGIRSASYGYGTDTVRQKYTGHERDGETGLDFAQARYYANNQGRFTGADSFAGSALDPQSLNLYAYSLNNPIKYSDPSGHTPLSASSIIDESTRYYCCRGEGLVIASPGTVATILKFLLGDYVDDPGDASHDVSEALRGPSALLINPAAAGAQVEVGIADTNLFTEIILGAEHGLKPEDFGVPTGTQLVVTDTIIDEIASKTGIARDTLASAAGKLRIDIRNPAADKLAAATKEISGLFPSGNLPKDPKKLGNTLTDLKIIADAKALGIGVLSNDTGVFQATVKGGGTLAKRLGVGFHRTTVPPKTPNFHGRFIKALANILK